MYSWPPIAFGPFQTLRGKGFWIEEGLQFETLKFPKIFKIRPNRPYLFRRFYVYIYRGE